MWVCACVGVPRNVTGYGLHAIYAAINATYVKWKRERDTERDRERKGKTEAKDQTHPDCACCLRSSLRVFYALLIIIVLFCIYLRSLRAPKPSVRLFLFV